MISTHVTLFVACAFIGARSQAAELALTADLSTSSSLLRLSGSFTGPDLGPVEVNSMRLAARTSRERWEGSETQSQGASTGLGLGLELPHDQELLLDVSLRAGRTPDFAFEEREAEVSLGFQSSAETTIIPIGIHVLVGRSASRQLLRFSVLNQTITRLAEVESRSIGLELTAEVDAQWLLNTSVINYEYSRSQEDLKRATESPLLQSRASTLLSTIAGLPAQIVSGGLIYLWSENFEVSLMLTRTKTFTENRTLASLSVLPTYQVAETLRGGIGLMTSFNEDMRSHALSLELSWQI